MNQEDIKSRILALFREKDLMKNLGADQDFFDLGVSSLTVVELQIVVEKELKIEVPTSVLMGSPTVAEWANVYGRKMAEQYVMEPEV